MTNKTKTTTAVILLLLAFCCLVFVNNQRKFQAKFYNKTGRDIESLKIGQISIGTLKKDSVTTIIEFDTFQFDGNLPIEEVTGLIKFKKLDNYYWSFCGIDHNTKSNGSHSFDIKKTVNENSQEVLFLSIHNKKMFWE